MCVDPAKYHEVLSIDIIEEVTLVQHLARIGRAFLLGYHKLGDEQCVGDQCPT